MKYPAKTGNEFGESLGSQNQIRPLRFRPPGIETGQSPKFPHEPASPYLPDAVFVPNVPNLKDDDHQDGRHQDRSGQHRQYRKHFCGSPEQQRPERAERVFVPRRKRTTPKLKGDRRKPERGQYRGVRAAGQLPDLGQAILQAFKLRANLRFHGVL